MEPARVLIVEDEYIVANDIQKSVESMGYGVSGIVTTGQAAIEATERERPDVVLMDIVLDDDMDGIRAAHEIGARFNTPFVFLSSFADDDVVRRARAVGPSGFMVKPFDDRELRANIEVAVHKAMMASKLRESEETVYRTFDQAPIGAAVVSLDFQFLRVNAELCRITGYSAEELLARGFMDITHPDDKDASLENARRLAAEEIDQYQIDKRYIRKDGEVAWIRSTVRMMKDLYGRPKHFLPMMEDITERKRAETAYAESEAFLKSVSENSPSASILKDLRGRYLSVNEQWLEWNAITREDVLGKTCFDIYPKEIAEQLTAVDQTVVATGNKNEQEFSRHFPDGIWRTILVVKFPIIDASGKIVGVGTNGADITDLKRANDETHLAQTRLNEAIESITDGFVLFDADERFVLCNQTYRKYLGKAADILEPGLPFEQIFRARSESGTFVNPAENVEEFVQARLEQFRNPGSPFELPLSNGEWRLVHDYRTRDGGIFIIGTDITDRKKAEEALRKSEELFRVALTNSPVLVTTMDRELRYTWIFNPLPGFSRKTVVGKMDADLLSPEDAAALTEFKKEVLDSGVGIRREFTLGTPEGPTTLDINCEPFRDAKGSVVGLTLAATDITDRKRAEEALRKAKEKAEFANRNKSEFLAVMAHELRSPLHGILGFSEVISSEMLGPISPPKYAEYAGDIHSSGEHLLSLINDLLDLSKIESGKMELIEEAVSLPEIVRGSQQLVNQRASNKELTLLTELAADLPSIYADRRAVQQVVHNLLTNSVKFTPQGGEITVGATAEPNGSVSVWCRDTGIGISPKNIPVILAPFGQVRNLEHGAGGSGLGLSIVKSLIKLHGGTLEVESELGAGTTVTVRFPLERVVD